MGRQPALRDRDGHRRRPRRAHRSGGLDGELSVPDLEIDPDPLEFGNRYVGCDNESADVELTNVGTDPGDRLSGVEDETMASPLGTMDSLPITLEPGELTNASFVFAPMDDADVFPGTCRWIPTSPTFSGPQTAGRRDSPGSYTDLWEIPSRPADRHHVCLIDQSCSMDDDASRLASNFSTFISLLSTPTRTTGRSSSPTTTMAAPTGCPDLGGVGLPEHLHHRRCRAEVERLTEALLTVAANAIERAAAGGCNWLHALGGHAAHRVGVG